VTQTPAGWYPDPTPDPAASSSLRYWDGTAWTAHVSPHQAPPAATGPTTPDGEPLAGWWWRVLAQVIDGTILGVVANVIVLPVQIRMQRELMVTMDDFVREAEQNPGQPPDFSLMFDTYADVLQENAFWLTVPAMAVALLYMAGFLRWKGGTPGKLMLGMRVRLRERPGTLPWSAIAARLSLQLVIPAIPIGAGVTSGSLALVMLGFALGQLIYLADVLWASWDDKRQTLHDKLARTNVVRTP